MDIPLRKVTARLDYKRGNTYTRVQPASRPASPTKTSPNPSLSSAHFRPKAKVNSSATVRKLSSSSSLATALSNDATSPNVSRPASPFKSSRTVASTTPNVPKPRITARPTSKSGSSQTPTNPITSESRQRSLTSVSSKLKPHHTEDRPRSGSVTLHHALSTSDLKPSSFPVGPQPSPLSDRSFGDSDQAGSPLLVPAKIKSKVTGLAKHPNAGDAGARSVSPPWATTRPIHPRTRAPSITANFPFNDSPTPSQSPVLYPITTATPAANPHRYAAARRAHSPLCDYKSFSISNEASVDAVKRANPIPKIDPTSIPLPPQSPPISAISLSSKSSVSRTSASLNSDYYADRPANVSTVAFRANQRSSEEKNTQNFSVFQSGNMDDGQERSVWLDKFVRSDSRPDESDVEPGGSERHLRAEAKTNRKIEDLEITNRSLLAINASLETTKNRQAKEIRDLRRKLRESRLILPPPTYRAVKSVIEEETGDDEPDDDDDSETFSDDATDVTFHRVRGLLESLIETGKRALEKKPGDFRESLATKVLNAEELRFWHVSGQHAALDGDQLESHDGEVDDETIHNHLSPTYIAMPDSDSEGSLESNQAALTLDPAPHSVSLPPITITHPP